MKHMSAVQWCPLTSPSGHSWVYHEVVSDMPVWCERNTWGVGCLESMITMHLYTNMKLKQKKGFNSHYNNAAGLCSPFHSNFLWCEWYTKNKIGFKYALTYLSAISQSVMQYLNWNEMPGNSFATNSWRDVIRQM